PPRRLSVLACSVPPFARVAPTVMVRPMSIHWSDRVITLHVFHRRSSVNQPAYLGDHAALAPDKPAVIMASTGAVRTYREVDEASNQLAQYLYGIGLRRGDHIAILMENNIRYLDVCWAAMR